MNYAISGIIGVLVLMLITSYSKYTDLQEDYNLKVNENITLQQSVTNAQATIEGLQQQLAAKTASTSSINKLLTKCQDKLAKREKDLSIVEENMKADNTPELKDVKQYESVTIKQNKTGIDFINSIMSDLDSMQ